MDRWSRAIAAGRRPIKVCCIRDAEEIRVAADRGVAAVGLVGPMPSGPGVLSDEAITELVRRVPDGMLGVLLTSERTVAGVVAHRRRTGADAIQLTAPLPPSVLAALRAALPEVWLAAVVHVADDTAVERARAAAQVGADAVLLDSGRPASQELGGTGRVHDWAVSRRVVKTVSVPVILAGGLRSDNAREAWTRVEPAGLDVCTGLRPGSTRALDASHLERFLAALP
ncbi:MAG TPA: phosphoribosylanthranilate isomerase [Sandaracinaceae bacterium LLY-WYZ-13_1]|nr:phosphoribosylanthranilate isomerase [Sandaracinaceae bacterium LLY-WYZ-13_1]